MAAEVVTWIIVTGFILAAAGAGLMLMGRHEILDLGVAALGLLLLLLGFLMIGVERAFA